MWAIYWVLVLFTLQLFLKYRISFQKPAIPGGYTYPGYPCIQEYIFHFLDLQNLNFKISVLAVYKKNLEQFVILKIFFIIKTRAFLTVYGPFHCSHMRRWYNMHGCVNLGITLAYCGYFVNRESNWYTFKSSNVSLSPMDSNL